MSDSEWADEVFDVIDARPESVFSGVRPDVSVWNPDDEPVCVFWRMESVASFEDIEWLSEAVDGDVKVAGGYAGELEVQIVKKPENGGEGL